jgi:TPP-dependent trihydroxycyclohexane-1,2-dione (THcHDO) dehydratase
MSLAETTVRLTMAQALLRLLAACQTSDRWVALAQVVAEFHDSLALLEIV